LENGTEVEVTDLMNLSFRETICGDGICGMPENYGTCPKDCPSGSYDNFCDGIKDGKCDPDCKEKYGESAIKMDPDCAEISNETICGDGKCNFPNENYETCPKDCPSGGYDNFCDRIKDGKCDPDCKEKYGESAIKMDPDCAEISNETICGDGKCNFPDENYRTCPKDCPRCGKDGKCNTDYKGDDPDCVNNQTDIPNAVQPTNTGIDTGLLTGAGILVLIALGYGIRRYIKTKKSIPK